MVRLFDSKLRSIRWRLKKGEVISNTDLADVVERYGACGIPEDVLALIATRLRAAKTPAPRGRPKNPNATVARALTIHNNVMVEWAQLGGRRGQREKAINAAAVKLSLSPETVRDALENDAPAARRAYPYLAFTLRQCVEALVLAELASDSEEAP